MPNTEFVYLEGRPKSHIVMKIVCWNINSIRARQERLLALLERHNPDVVCLQELKVETDAFPYAELDEAGYYCAVHGQKTYNGVAILSREKPEEVESGWPDGPHDMQSRLIAATFGEIRVVCVYVPNGRTVGSAPWSYKLDWLDRLGRYLSREQQADGPLMVCGDFNVAPSDDEDIAFPERWQNTVLTHDDARKAFFKLLDSGLVDLVRAKNDPPGPFTWWDYRQLAFPKGDGVRIDHILVSSDLQSACSEAWVDRDERKGKKPSDHAPVLAVFDV